MTARIGIMTIVCAGLLLMACADARRDLGSAAQAVGPDDGCLIDDSLFVGDRGAHDTVEEFDANDGAYLGAFVTHQSGGLRGPAGLIFSKRGNGNAELLVVNQNSGTVLNGEVLRYDADNGTFLGALVPASDPNAPFFPRGMVLGKHHVLYIADQGDATHLPRVARFDAKDGSFLGNLDPSGLPEPFIPRDLVFGPDGQLYVAVIPSASVTVNGGYIARFDPKTGKATNVVLAFPSVNRPGGLVFGPDGRLYVISSRLNIGDTDKILIVDVEGGVGTVVDHIDLDQVGGPRTLGLALIFGPDGDLFVTIPAPASVRRYDLQTKMFVDFVPPPPTGPLVLPFYLTFRNTDPGTLAYKPKGRHCP